MKFVLTFEVSGDIGLDEKPYQIYPLESTIGKAFESKDYGKGLIEFHLVLQLLAPAQAAGFPEGQLYRPRKKEAVIAKLLDVEKVALLNEQAWKMTVFQEVLKQVLRCPELKIKDFDYRSFHDDLKAFFEQHGWI